MTIEEAFTHGFLDDGDAAANLYFINGAAVTFLYRAYTK